MSGPLFFGAADLIETITHEKETRALIMRMRSVPALDATALRSLKQLRKRCEEHGVTLIFSHVNDQPMHAMQKSGFYDEVGAENFCAHIDDAIARAEQI